MAKKEIIALTAADRDYIQALGNKVHHSVNNTTNRPAPYADDGGFSSEVYIAKTGVDVIPAMTTSYKDVGTGTDTESIYHPGVAECAVYTIREHWSAILETDVPELSLIDNYNKQVYNLSSCEIPAETWVLLNLTKGGKWVIAESYATCTPSGTGSGSTTGTGTGTGTGTYTGTGVEPTGTDTGTSVDPTGTDVEPTGTDVEPTGTNIEPTGTDVEPSGTGTSGCATIPGVDFATLPISTSPDYILGIKDGCLVRVPVGNCDATGTG